MLLNKCNRKSIPTAFEAIPNPKPFRIKIMTMTVLEQRHIYSPKSTGNTQKRWLRPDVLFGLVFC